MKRWRPICVLLIAALSVFSGCKGPEESPFPRGKPPVVKGVPLEPFTDAKKHNQRDFVLVVRTNLITVRVPVGSVSNSEDLWSYLDEEPAGAYVGSALACNGIRVGLGRKGAWKNVTAILQKLTGQPLVHTSLLSRPGTPMPIVFKSSHKSQTIFTYRRDTSLVGQDYPAGDNVLVTTATINYDDPSAVHMTAAAAVRSKRRRRGYIKHSGKYAFTSEPIYYRLDGMDFRLKVPRGDFIIIGPAAEARRQSSPGYHFLIHQRNALQFETVVIIAPEVFAAPVKKDRSR
jgi:hypothetical protein